MKTFSKKLEAGCWKICDKLEGPNGEWYLSAIYLIGLVVTGRVLYHWVFPPEDHDAVYLTACIAILWPIAIPICMLLGAVFLVIKLAIFLITF